MSWACDWTHGVARRADVAVTCDWAPDGRHLLTSTTAPRLRVDNGYQIWKSVSASTVLLLASGLHWGHCVCMHPCLTS